MKTYRILLAFIAILLLSTTLNAQSAREIDAGADRALEQFHRSVKGSLSFVENDVKGLLIFPSIVRAGIGIGGEYGEGVLRINGKSKMYFSVTSASVGLQFGVQSRSLILAFMTQQALDDFMRSNRWQVGIDGSVALVNLGGGKTLDSSTINQPVVAFVFGNRGLMYNLTVEGSRFTRISR